MTNSTGDRRWPLGLSPGQPTPSLCDRVVEVLRAREWKGLAPMLRHDGVEAVLRQLDGVRRLVWTLLYGSGLRLLEGLQLRAKDLHFGRDEISVRDGKGHKDRVTMVPHVLHQPLQEHLRAVREQHEADLTLGLGRAPLPDAVVRKYPNADREWVWQWVFPASSHYLDRRTGVEHRHDLHESVVQKAIREAALRAHLSKRVTGHTFRHCFATHLLRVGYDIRTVQELLGHSDVRTTMIYTDVLNRGGHGVHSPLDRLRKPVAGEEGGSGLPSGRPNTGKERCQLHGKSLESKAVVAIAGRQHFHLRPAGLEF